MDNYETISKKVDKLLFEKCEEKTDEKEKEMRTIEEYRIKREQISQKIRQLEIEKKIN